jgi:hypothetical protein
MRKITRDGHDHFITISIFNNDNTVLVQDHYPTPAGFDENAEKQINAKLSELGKPTLTEDEIELMQSLVHVPLPGQPLNNPPEGVV